MRKRGKYLCLTMFSKPRQSFFILIGCVMIFSMFFLYNKRDYDTVQYVQYRFRNTSAELVDGYLVWNPKCHMLSKDPFDPAVRDYVWKEEVQNCSDIPVLTSIIREPDGQNYLIINSHSMKYYNDLLSCCWAPVTRPDRTDNLDIKFDSKISVEKCTSFRDRVAIPQSVEVAQVTCTSGNSSYIKQMISGSAYENVHAVIHPEKVKKRLKALNVKSSRGRDKKLSVLMLGIDNVSRLNFYRTMPLIRAYVENRGWFELKGYNKMGDNTFPNVMAFLTGQNESESFSKCKPDIPFGLDNCPFIWKDFQKAGYVTAYGEDSAFINTFNFLKVGFVKAPTDYYLRPYVLAYENLLKGTHRFFAKYCAGPSLAFDRIFDYALDFAKTFVGVPYFGLFWVSSISHENVNGPSVVDDNLRNKLERMEADGLMEDAMIVLFSDHGMRYGSIRNSFIGWYEERLPFFYVWLPKWFREQEPEVVKALQLNRNRLTSPFDLYETLRDVIRRAGGSAPASSGCPTCSSLLHPVPRERGCEDAGVSAHWCTCDAFELASTTDEIVVEGAHQFIDHLDRILGEYRDEAGTRLCAKPRFKKINSVQKVVDLDKSPDGSVLELFYSLEVDPGDMKFEATIRYLGSGNYTIRDEEVSRLDSYAEGAKCLNFGFKKYCHCEN